MELPVTALEDVIQGHIWMATGPECRGSHRPKVLADIARLVGTYPEFLPQVPADLRQRLFDLYSVFTPLLSPRSGNPARPGRGAGVPPAQDALPPAWA